MNQNDDIIKAAQALLYLQVLGGPITRALSIAISNYAPFLIVKAVSLTRYPIIFKGQIVNYADCCGYCEVSGYKIYRLLYMPSFAYCPGCRTIHQVDDETPPSAPGVLLEY